MLISLKLFDGLASKFRRIFSNMCTFEFFVKFTSRYNPVIQDHKYVILQRLRILRVALLYNKTLTRLSIDFCVGSAPNKKLFCIIRALTIIEFYRFSDFWGVSYFNPKIRQIRDCAALEE